jgi:hypothetical protein
MIHASGNDHSAVLELLLVAGIDIDVKDKVSLMQIHVRRQ